MLHRNNLYNIRINNISGNGTLNMGDAIQKGHSANSEGVGGQTIVGDEHLSPVTHDYNMNFYNDPDIIDQPQKQV